MVLYVRMYSDRQSTTRRFPMNHANLASNPLVGLRRFSDQSSAALTRGPRAATNENAKIVEYRVASRRAHAAIVGPHRRHATQNIRIMRLLVGTPTLAAKPLARRSS